MESCIMNNMIKQFVLAMLLCGLYEVRGMDKQDNLLSANSTTVSDLQSSWEESVLNDRHVYDDDTRSMPDHNKLNYASNDYENESLYEWMKKLNICMDDRYFDINRMWMEAREYGSISETFNALNDAINIISNGSVNNYSTWYSIYLLGCAEYYLNDDNIISIESIVQNIYKKLNTQKTVSTRDAISCITNQIFKYENKL